MTTAPKLPEGLEPVAWQYVSEDPLDGGQLMLSEERPNRRAVWPLVRLSDAQAALLAQAAEKDAEIAFLKLQIETGPLYSTRLKAKRYEFLRDTNDAMWRPFGIREGTADEADAAIDSALLAEKEAK